MTRRSDGMTRRFALRGTGGLVALLALTVGAVGCVSSPAAPEEVAPSASASAEESTEPSTEPSGDPSIDPSAVAGAIAECIQGTWTEDLVNLKAQLPAMPSFQISSLEGMNTLTIDGDTLTYAVDYITVMEPTIDSPIHGQGITRGSTTHAFTLGVGTTDIYFAPATASDVVVEWTLFTGEEASPAQAMPWDGGFGDSGFVTCTGDTMTIDPDSSGWIHLFTR